MDGSSAPSSRSQTPQRPPNQQQRPQQPAGFQQQEQQQQQQQSFQGTKTQQQPAQRQQQQSQNFIQGQQKVGQQPNQNWLPGSIQKRPQEQPQQLIAQKLESKPQQIRSQPLQQTTPAKPQQLQTPKLQQPQLQTPKLQQQQLQTPKLQEQQLQTPKLQQQQLQTPKLQQQQLQTPKLQQQQMQTPKLQQQQEEWPLAANKESVLPKVAVSVVAPSKDIPEDVVMEELKKTDSELAVGEELDESGKRRSWFGKIRRKKKSVRIKESRLRQNRRLRKILLPKNAQMALHETKGVTISEFILNNQVGGGFTAEVTVNNIQYEGFGISKNGAKNDACEKALRDLIISKMLQRSLKKDEADAELESKEAKSADGDMEISNIEQKEEEDDVPILNLASFAIYKLFSEWEHEGFDIPELRPNGPASSTAGNGSMNNLNQNHVARKELPPNWETMHPATLLCIMRPGVTYTDNGCDGNPPNNVQYLSVIVDNKEYTGKGRSKKLARKNLATTVCNSLFGTNFPVDMTS